MRLTISGWFGRALNALGVPGLVRECKYKSTETDTFVSVRVGQLYSVVSVNGVDVYFHRITGRIDGVGVTPISGYREWGMPKSIDSAEPPAGFPATVQTGRSLGRNA
jgi:hypothetical protein